MGCLQSKRETSDLHPNVFRVTNVDRGGGYLCTGQLEITENDLILYREGRDTTVWPLHSLRRYGFDGNLFSFEAGVVVCGKARQCTMPSAGYMQTLPVLPSTLHVHSTRPSALSYHSSHHLACDKGRRCDTGEGIYAFKCSRASLLFRNLQQQILLRNAMISNPVSRLSPSPQGRQTLQASVVHRSSIDNGQPINMRPVNNSNLPNIISDTVVPRNVTQSPRSPSSADILEVMPLYPRPQNSTNQVTNIYQLRHIKREHNNNHSDPPLDTGHVYSNDLIRDLAILRNTLREESALNTMRDIEDETRFLKSRYINEKVANNHTNNNALSPTLSTASEHYNQLSELEQQQLEQEINQQQQLQSHQEQSQLLQPHQQQKVLPRLYMNIVPNEANIPEASKSDTVPSTPLNPKPIEYSNLTIGSKTEVNNTYANLSLGELGDSIKSAKHLLGLSSSEYKQKYSELDSIASMSPVEEIEVSYAVLDIDSNKEVCKTTKDSTLADSTSIVSGSVHQSRGRLVSQASIDKPNTANAQSVAPGAAIGYTTIDFDKTVALSSVAAGEEVGVGLEGCRKTRHNSCNIIISGTGNPANNDKSK